MNFQVINKKHNLLYITLTNSYLTASPISRFVLQGLFHLGDMRFSDIIQNRIHSRIECFFQNNYISYSIFSGAISSAG
jgi:hypothetical protein